MHSPPAAELTQSLKSLAKEAGFFLCGAAPAIRPPHYDFFCQWLDRGLAGGMSYLPDRRAAYAHPRSILDRAQSVLMLGASYFVGYGSDLPLPAGHGRIAKYAWGGEDYHDWIHPRLKKMIQSVQKDWPSVQARGVVDTAPLLERDFARLAGLGWVGKNTLSINKRFGSYFFLAAIILDAELEYDQPHESDHCGTCTRCLEACPTQAFPEPGVLDARRCISYLTIEHRGAVDPQLREGIGDWWFGCDVCQDVCPWNRHADVEPLATPTPATLEPTVSLREILLLDEASFRERFRGTPMWRSKREGAVRNAAYVVGNRRDPSLVEELSRLLATDTSPTVRGACAWALGRIATPTADKALQQQQAYETDAEVQNEIRAALSRRPNVPVSTNLA